MHVYILQRPDGLVKIGRSINPVRRIRSLETQGGFSAEKTWVSQPVDDAGFVERTVHGLLSDKRGIGEWFDCEFNDAVSSAESTVSTVAKPTETIQQRFAARLNQALDSNGYPLKHKGRQARLGNDLSVTSKAASYWLEGKKLPDMKHAVEIAELVGVCVEWLLTGRGPMTPDQAYRKRP